MKDRPTLAEEPVTEEAATTIGCCVCNERLAETKDRGRGRVKASLVQRRLCDFYFFIFHLVQLLSSLKPQTTIRLLRSSVTPNSRYLTNVQLFNECFQYLTTVQPSIECSASCRGGSQDLLTAFLCFQRGNPFPDWFSKQYVMVGWWRELGQKFYWDGGECMI